MSSFNNLITDRTQADVDAGTSRGSYGAADLNRVGEAANTIREMLSAYGYTVGDAFRVDWSGHDVPRQSDMEAYIAGLIRLRDSIRFSAVVPALPPSMERFTYLAANQIETMLLSLGVAVEGIPATWFEGGVVEAGVAYA